ncbi:hypothetical protein F4703DRAFT_1881171 [Phycomyces blakesleeanus]
MSASDLPFEILSNIARFTPTSDKCCCILACKAWKIPFQESLWRKIQVYSMKELENISDIINSSTNKTMPFNLMTTDIRFTGIINFTGWQKNNVFQAFPNLEYIDMGSLFFSEIKMDEIKSNLEWSSITKLKTKFKHTRSRNSTIKMLGILRSTPNLRVLDIGPHYRRVPLELSLQLYNNLHNMLPSLTSMAANLALDDINRRDARKIRKTEPALHLTSLYLHLTSWDSMWLYYFAYKYPNLRTLKWRAPCQTERGVIIKEYGEEEVSLLRSIKKVFPSLESLDFYTEETTELSHAILWEFICRSSVPLKTLHYKLKFGASGAIFLGTVIRRLLQSFIKTLERISVIGDFCFEKDNIVEPEFPFSARLVSIEIKDCGISIALDNLLDNYPALLQLTFYNGQLYISPEAALRESRQHGLKLLNLNSIEANASVLSYTSFRCRNLQYMDLGHSEIHGSSSTENGSLYIDMSYTSFKSLEFSDAMFYYSNDDDYNYDDDPSKNTAINLVLLSRLAGNCPATGKQDIKKSEYSVEHLAWYHFYCELEYVFDFTLKIRKLSEQEVISAVDYFKESQLKKDRENISEVERSGFGLVDKDYWKEDLCRGYVELRCGHIAKY